MDLSYSGLDEFKEPEFKGYGPENNKKESNVVCDKESKNSKDNFVKSLVEEQVSQVKSSFVEGCGSNTSKSVSEVEPKKVRKNNDAPIIKDWVSDDEEQDESKTKPEKKTVIPTAGKIEKPVKKSVRYAEMYRSQIPRGNQRNWNGQKSNQLGIKTRLGISKEVGTPRYLSLVVPLTKVGDEAVHKELGDRMERAAATASSLEAEQDSGSGPRCQDTILGDVNAQTRFEITSKQSIDPPLSRGYTLGSGEDSMKLIGIDKILLKLVLSVFVSAVKRMLMLPVQVSAVEVNPVIYTSCIEQFWATAKVQTVNGVRQLQALVDKKRVIVTESSIRRDLHLDDAEGTDCLPTATIFEELARMGYEKPSQKLTFYKAFFLSQWKYFIHTITQCLSAKSTAWNEFSSSMASLIICLATNQKFNLSKYIFETLRWRSQILVKHKSSKKAQRQEAEVPQDETEHEESVPTPSNDPQPSGEDSMQLTDLMILCTKLQTQVLDLQKAKDAQAKEIDALKKRIQRLERRKMSRPTGLKRLSEIGMIKRVESSEDQESLGIPEDASKQGRSIEDINADVDVSLVDETQERQDDDLIFDSEVLEVDVMHVEAKVDGKDDQSKKLDVTTAGIDDNTGGEAVTTAGDDSAVPTTNEKITLAQTLIQIKAAKPKVVTTAATTTTTTRPKDRGVVVHEPSEFRVPQKIKPSSSKDKGKEEQKLARKQEEEANIALIESWDNTQAMMEADRLLAERLQSKEREELTDEEKAKLFMELMEKRRKNFAAPLSTRKRNGPPTKSQTENQCLLILSTWENKEKKEEGREETTKGEEEKESEEVEEDDEVELKKLLVIKKDEDIAIDAIPLATKLLVISDYKLHKEGMLVHYELIRADGSSKRYSSMIRMLQGIDKEDLEALWRIVKAKYGDTRPKDKFERVLYGDLRVMFEADIKSDVWRMLQGYRVITWKLIDSSGVHFIRFDNLHIFMLVERRYPITPITITNMLNKKLQTDHQNKMCYQLLKLMIKQQKGK
ncbi:hypothetical protein Tco_0352404 [Tanacetum coccineum]